MGWFSKNKQRTQESGGNFDEIPPLPRLPEIPNDPYDDSYDMTQLPTIPSNTLNQKFSENVIKDAISPSSYTDPNKVSYSSGFSREIDEDIPIKYKGSPIQRFQSPNEALLPPPERKLPPMQNIEIPKIEELSKPVEQTKYKSKESVPAEFKDAADKVKSSQPVFIRIDKFQKALEIIDETQDKITEMKKNLNEIKKIREEEDAELESWDNEISKLKEKIEKIDDDLFSRVE